MTHVRQRFGSRGAGIAVTLSLLGHAGIALVAAHHAPRAIVASPASSAVVGTFVSEFAIDEDDEPPEPLARANAAMPTEHPALRGPVVHASLTAARSSARDTEAEPEREAASVADDSGGPRFAMTVGPTIGTNSGAGSLSPRSVPGKAFAAVIPAAVIPAAIADTPARLRAGTVPAYTPAALSAGVEANVPLEIVVSENGNVTSARVLEHVGYGLDEAAQQSVLGYRFTPAVRSGKPIAVRMRWLMRFQLA